MRAPARHHRAGDARGRRVHDHPAAVQAADRLVPGGRPPPRRLLHRRGGDPPHDVAGRGEVGAGADASEAIATAKFWAAEAGHRVAHAVVHVHGGMGIAEEHFVHRCAVHAKQNEFSLGGATEQRAAHRRGLRGAPAGEVRLTDSVQPVQP
ncbi:acyl-CoA dehydrogenase family protein [Yinghuangia aomiensis]